ENYGATWQLSNYFANSIDTEYTFVPNGMAANGSVILVAEDALAFLDYTHTSFLYVSSDNGVTWTKTKLNFQPLFVSFNAGAFYIGSVSDGLFRSVDNGVSWNPVGFNSKAAVTSLINLS